MDTFELPNRMRRLRRTPTMRRLVKETRLSTDNLVYPLFIKQGLTEKKAISSMPDQYQLALTDLKHEIAELDALNIPAVILFGIPEKKDALGSTAYSDEGIVQQAISEIKTHNQSLLVVADLCFCEYTNHGHCGMLNGEEVDNDSTLYALQRQAISLAKAGADIIAPSGMMDGMVAAIRRALDGENFQHIPILSYAAKYSSAFYGPFREAAEGAPQFGDRSAYQMDTANANEALREVALDIEEGADMLMVKPALSYLDIITRIKQTYPEYPLSAYQVSGEYAMIKLAAKHGLINEQDAMLESVLSIKRAGADFILTYFAKDLAKLLNQPTA